MELILRVDTCRVGVVGRLGGALTVNWIHSEAAEGPAGCTEVWRLEVRKGGWRVVFDMDSLDSLGITYGIDAFNEQKIIFWDPAKPGSYPLNLVPCLLTGFRVSASFPYTAYFSPRPVQRRNDSISH